MPLKRTISWSILLLTNEKSLQNCMNGPSNCCCVHIIFFGSYPRYFCVASDLKISYTEAHFTPKNNSCYKNYIRNLESRPKRIKKILKFCSLKIFAIIFWRQELCWLGFYTYFFKYYIFCVVNRDFRALCSKIFYFNMELFCPHCKMQLFEDIFGFNCWNIQHTGSHWYIYTYKYIKLIPNNFTNICSQFRFHTPLLLPAAFQLQLCANNFRSHFNNNNKIVFAQPKAISLLLLLLLKFVVHCGIWRATNATKELFKHLIELLMVRLICWNLICVARVVAVVAFVW